MTTDEPNPVEWSFTELQFLEEHLIADNYGGVEDESDRFLSGRSEDDIGREILDGRNRQVPEELQKNVSEGGEKFWDVKTLLSGGRPSLDEDDYRKARKGFEESLDHYETAVEVLIEDIGAHEIVDREMVIERAKSGRVDNVELFSQLAGLRQDIRDWDMHEHERDFRRRTSEGDDYGQELEDMGYDVEAVVRSEYQERFEEIGEAVDRGLEEIASETSGIEYEGLGYQPGVA